VAVARCLPRADQHDDAVLTVQHPVELLVNALSVRAKCVPQRHISTPRFASVVLPSEIRRNDVRVDHSSLAVHQSTVLVSRSNVIVMSARAARFFTFEPCGQTRLAPGGPHSPADTWGPARNQIRGTGGSGSRAGAAASVPCGIGATASEESDAVSS
jgi:hypothetical protein